MVVSVARFLIQQRLVRINLSLSLLLRVAARRRVSNMGWLKDWALKQAKTVVDQEFVPENLDKLDAKIKEGLTSMGLAHDLNITISRGPDGPDGPVAIVSITGTINFPKV